MHSIRIHRVVDRLISLLHFIGVWHRGDKPTMKEALLKLYCCIHYALFTVSLAVGAVKSEGRDESIFLLDIAIGTGMLTTKLWVLTWRQNGILKLLNRVCVFSIRSDDDHKRFEDKIRGLMTIGAAFVISSIVAGCLGSVVLSIIGGQKNLFLKIGFPLDYENSETAFWIALTFVFVSNILFITVTVFTIIIWYLMFVCAMRYKVLGSELKKMGRTSDEGHGKQTGKLMSKKHFVDDLKTSIDAHLDLKDLTDQVKSFFGEIYLVQFGISSLCICGTVYSLSFGLGGLSHRLVYGLVLFYLLAELFMITYFGNEVKLLSGRLSYSLFESDWYNQSPSTNKCIVIFGEYLKQPQEMVIGKVYPLSLETFTRILNSAYSMFNILQNLR